MDGLDTLNRRLFGASILQKNKRTEEEEFPGYYDIIDFLKGHPYFTQILLSGSINGSKIKEDFGKILSGFVASANILDEKSIFALFEYGWNNIPKDCQLVLLAFSNLTGYITDGLPITVDIQKGESPAGKELYDLLGIKRLNSTAEAFNYGCNIGLFVKKQFGYEVNPLASDYLTLKVLELNWSNEKLEKSAYILSKLYSLELRIISSFLLQNPNPVLYQKVVENNKRWFKALELLWNKKDYQHFMDGKHFLASLLNKVGMKNEIDAWNLKLIKSSDSNEFNGNVFSEDAMAWLKTASDALEDKNALSEKNILSNVKYWKQCLIEERVKDTEVFSNATMFLESYYRKIKNWESRKMLSEISIKFYEKNENYEFVITAKRSLARCEEVMGNVIECKAIENDILTNIPYEKTGKGTKENAMLNIAVNRILRKEFKEANDLIEEVKKISDLNQILIAAENLQGEILYNLEKFEDALACYARAWKLMMKGEHEYNYQKTIQRFKELSEKLTHEKYSEIFKREAPDIKLPINLIGDSN